MEQVVCSVACAKRVPIIARNTLKAGRKATKDALAKLKPRSKWMQEAQQAFNAWIRYRDRDQGCISCGTHDGKVNAGHYLSTGARPELRFEPLNVHRQCERCNTYLHGNLIAYRVELIRRIGQEIVEALEGPHPPRKFTIPELQAIRDQHRTKVKEATT
jgi:hypothetical protein